MTRAEFALCLMEMGKADCGEASLPMAMRARPQLLLLAIRSLAASSHGRFFLYPSAVAKNYLEGDKR